MSATEKVSVTLERRDIDSAKQIASHLGLSLSTFIADAVRDRIAEQQRREAAKAVLGTFPPEDRATAEEMIELLQRWGEAARPGAQETTTPGAALAAQDEALRPTGQGRCTRPAMIDGPPASAARAERRRARASAGRSA